ncbi:MAG: hypothetical protein CMH61_00335 [Nanoarchaeota archaeon]|nr:hypothetical protein [Nanoarchaeota archaeon]|tara:strand:- start:3460 stop:4017 length:558 start_codon:yes stop_codon:yes gene_type:complete
MIIADMNPRTVLAQLDPKLHFEEQYSPNPVVSVYQVTLDSIPFIVKCAFPNERRYVDTEIEALHHLDGLPLTPDLKEVYEKEIMGLRKTYMPGVTLGNYISDFGGDISKFKEQGRELVEQVHACGVYRLVLNFQNVLVNDSTILLFDFDEVFFEGQFDKRLVRKFKSDDLDKIETLLDPKKVLLG